MKNVMLLSAILIFLTTFIVLKQFNNLNIVLMKFYNHLLAIGFFRIDLAIALLFVVWLFVYSTIAMASIVGLIILVAHYVLLIAGKSTL